MKTLIKGGCIVSGSGVIKADVLIDGEKISQVEENITCTEARVVDATDKLIFPGFIDAHTHFDLEVAGTVTADNFYTGSRAAIKGGTTTVVDFAAPNKGETLASGLKRWHEKADGKSVCDYGFHMTIDDWNDEISREIDDMTDEGIFSFKMYMTYPAMMLGDRDMYFALKRLKEIGGIVGVHCENSGVIDALIAEKKALGEMLPSSHPETRPAILEAEAIGRLLKMAAIVDVPVVIVHLSSEVGMEEVRTARAKGQKVYVETCPQYLLLDDSRYYLQGFEGAKYVCAPPLRKKKDSECLWQALKNNEIQTISTDHCSFNLKQKEMGVGDFTKIPGGIPGVETRGSLIYTYGVCGGRISLEQMCCLLSENPAKLYGLYPQKGTITPGSDADIVIYDTVGESVINAEDQLYNVDYAPFENFKIKGKIEKVFLRGSVVFENGKVIERPVGKYIKRSKCCL